MIPQDADPTALLRWIRAKQTPRQMTPAQRMDQAISLTANRMAQTGRRPQRRNRMLSAGRVVGPVALLVTAVAGILAAANW